MKKFLTILIIFVFVCIFVACDAKKPIEIDNSTSCSNTTDASTDVVLNKAEVTIDSIVKLFDEEYNVQKYTSNMITHLIPSLESNGVTLIEDISAIVHLTAKNSAPELSDWSWAYIYEFTNEADAIAFEENRRTFVETTEENGACVRCGLIVVFGSAMIISSIAQ